MSFLPTRQRHRCSFYSLIRTSTSIFFIGEKGCPRKLHVWHLRKPFATGCKTLASRFHVKEHIKYKRNSPLTIANSFLWGAETGALTRTPLLFFTIITPTSPPVASASSVA